MNYGLILIAIPAGLATPLSNAKDFPVNPFGGPSKIPF
jgi:hypothetical protein